MSAHVILVILVATTELRSAATESMLRATRETLGPSATLRLETYNATEGVPPPRPRDGQHAYVVLSWNGENHAQARIQGRMPESNDAVDRALSFATADPEEERGRSVGFVIASFVAGSVPPSSATTAETTRPPADFRHETAVVTKPSYYAVSLAASAAFPKSADSFGAYFDATRQLGRKSGLGFFVDGRFGSIPSAQASTRWLSLGAVGRFGLWQITERTWLSLIVQAHVTQLAIAHLSEDDKNPNQQVAYFPGTAMSLRLSQDLSHNTAAYLDLGAAAEAVSGGTVSVHGRPESTIPIVYGIGRVGVVARF